VAGCRASQAHLREPLWRFVGQGLFKVDQLQNRTISKHVRAFPRNPRDRHGDPRHSAKGRAAGLGRGQCVSSLPGGARWQRSPGASGEPGRSAEPRSARTGRPSASASACTPGPKPSPRRRPADSRAQARVRRTPRNVITWPDGHLPPTSRVHDDLSRDPVVRVRILVKASRAWRSDSGRVWR
jgi:hypothetical protein